MRVRTCRLTDQSADPSRSGAFGHVWLRGSRSLTITFYCVGTLIWRETTRAVRLRTLQRQVLLLLQSYTLQLAQLSRTPNNCGNYEVDGQRGRTKSGELGGRRVFM